MNMLHLPKKVYFKSGCLPVALRELGEVYRLKRAFLVSDPGLYRAGLVTSVDDRLRRQGIRTAEFFSISSPPSFAEIRSALPKLLEFEPDVIVGVGGGSAMSAAKALWALYEDPALDPAEAAAHPERIRTGAKAKLVLAAASFGSGAQNSPFAVLKDDSGGLRVLCSPALLPELSVTDAQFTATLSPAQVKACGLAVLSRSLGAFAAADEDAYGRGMLGEAVRLVLENFSAAEAGRPDALERLHNAGALMGAAAAEPDPAAPFWPAEPKGLEPLARELGFPDVQALQKACEALL